MCVYVCMYVRVCVCACVHEYDMTRTDDVFFCNSTNNTEHKRVQKQLNYDTTRHTHSREQRRSLSLSSLSLSYLEPLRSVINTAEVAGLWKCQDIPKYLKKFDTSEIYIFCRVFVIRLFQCFRYNCG